MELKLNLNLNWKFCVYRVLYPHLPHLCAASRQARGITSEFLLGPGIYKLFRSDWGKSPEDAPENLGICSGLTGKELESASFTPQSPGMPVLLQLRRGISKLMDALCCLGTEQSPVTSSRGPGNDQGLFSRSRRTFPGL